jgi:hypothetical protein
MINNHQYSSQPLLRPCGKDKAEAHLQYPGNTGKSRGIAAFVCINPSRSSSRTYLNRAGALYRKLGWDFEFLKYSSCGFRDQFYSVKLKMPAFVNHSVQFASENSMFGPTFDLVPRARSYSVNPLVTMDRQPSQK